MDFYLCRTSTPAGAFTRAKGQATVCATASADRGCILCRRFGDLHVDRNQPFCTERSIRLSERNPPARHGRGSAGHRAGDGINSFIGTLTIAEGGIWGSLAGISVGIVASTGSITLPAMTPLAYPRALAGALLLFTDKSLELHAGRVLSRFGNACVTAGKQIATIAAIIFCASIIVGVLGTGLYLIPLAMISTPQLLDVSNTPLAGIHCSRKDDARSVADCKWINSQGGCLGKNDDGCQWPVSSFFYLLRASDPD